MTSSRLESKSMYRQNIFEGSTKMLTLLYDPRIGFYKVRKQIGAETLD
jgi:hypothetical protein